MSTKNLVALAAGGTGGHLFPAQALAEVLTERGHRIHLITDERVHDYGKAFPAEQTHVVPSASKPFQVPGNALRLWRGVRTARSIFQNIKPAAVVGFGGYPSLPPLLAAGFIGVPAILHEQNAVLGRANRLLSRRVAAIATSFPQVFNLASDAAKKVAFTGNPVRQLVLNVAGAPYPALTDQSPIHLVVFGGSQGARFFSDIMPGALAAMPEALRKRLIAVQQCRHEDLERVRAAYAALGVRSELAPFFADMPSIIAAAHLVICRSGASSITELGVIGRPAILVPLPHAIDNDQQKNAESFAAAGAGYICPQNTLTADSLAGFLTQLLSQPQALKEAAIAAAKHGKPDAAQKLADLVERHMLPVPVRLNGVKTV
jgi:UDP-N-acetylglucosamine--N-acetylmuramyl-(pentapeptide) pyrophosphoryl-undecaprenol N-acetylglucosamine transferase